MLNLRENEYNSPLVPWTQASGADGLATLGTSQGRKYLLEGFLTADRYFGSHEFTVTGGGSLETNDREKVRAEVMRKLNAAKGGGYIFQSDHSIPNNVDPGTYDFVVKLVREHGRYPLNLGEYALDLHTTEGTNS